MEILLMAAVAQLAATVVVTTSPLSGTWTNPAHSITVRIGQCGKAVCGRVTSASVHAREAAAKAGTRRLIGTELISDIEQTQPDRWRAQIFVPDENIHSTGDISLASRDEISVRGCMVGGLICKQQSWTRVAARGRRSASGHRLRRANPSVR